MSDTAAKTPKMKGKWGLVAKLVIGVGALTGAVERYVDLAQKNELVYEALSTKVNAMSDELAEVRGQNKIIVMFLSKQMGGEMGALEKELDAEPTPISESADVEADEGAAEAAAPAEEPARAPASLPPKPEKKAKSVAAEKRVKIDAYQQLPANIDGLKQMQVQEESHAAE